MDLDDVGLKHVPFFAAVGESTEDTREAAIAKSGLLMMRLIDHWILVGPEMVQPESASVRSNREAAMEIPASSPYRPLMLGIVNEMQLRREVDLEGVFPRLAEYAVLLDQEEWSKPLAADVRYTIERLGRKLAAADEFATLFMEALRLAEEEERQKAGDRARKKAKPKKKRKKRPEE
ncbi:MAG: hypothetical protein ACREN6_16820 [Gemmatimonadaceae bacterium]